MINLAARLLYCIIVITNQTIYPLSRQNVQKMANCWTLFQALNHPPLKLECSENTYPINTIISCLSKEKKHPDIILSTPNIQYMSITSHHTVTVITLVSIVQ